MKPVAPAPERRHSPRASPVTVRFASEAPSMRAPASIEARLSVLTWVKRA
jgi:hypothetical protein